VEDIHTVYIAIKLFFLKDLFIVILFLFVVVFLFIRIANTDSVEDIINKYIAARGGINRLNFVKSVSMAGTKMMAGNEVMVKITKVDAKLFRTDMEIGGHRGYQIITENKGWNYSPFNSYSAEEIPMEKLQLFKNELDIFGPLVNYRAKGFKAKLLGKDLLYDRDCHKIQLTSRQGKDSFYFIDCKTFLLLQSRKKIETEGKVYGNSPETITNFRNYKNFSGILFPQIIETEGVEGRVESVLFYEIETNIAVDENLYLP
jgi:hypothetical protein